MCVSETQISRVEEKNINREKNSFAFVFQKFTHTHTQKEREKLGHCHCCWLVCLWPSNILWGCYFVLSTIDGLRKMNKESGNELLIKLSNSKEGKDWTLLFYYYLPTILMILGWFLKICLSNTTYIMLILRFWFYISNIWNVRLTLVLSNSKRKGKKELWAKINTTTTTTTCLGNICERGKNKQIASSHNRILRKLYKHKFSLI